MERKFNKERLFKILLEFDKGNTKAKVFCDQFYMNYDLIADFDDLTEHEEKILNKLSDVVNLYSPYEDDFKIYKFTTEKDIKKAVKEAIKELKK